MSLTTAPVAWLHHAARDQLLALGDTHVPDETGGLLLGYRHGPTEIVITDAIGPGPNADHRRGGFEPDTDWQTAELAVRYAAAGRRLQYIGDWHTHPGGATTLSGTDRQTLRAIARHPDARCPDPVMAVLAGGDPWTFAIWQTKPRALRRARLERLDVHHYR